MHSLPLLFIVFLVGAIAGFLLGRGAGVHASQTARAADRIDAERLLSAEKQAAALAKERLLATERERDARAAELPPLRESLEKAQTTVNQVGARAAGLDESVRSLEAQLAGLREHERIALEAAAAIIDRLQRELGDAERVCTRFQTELTAERELGAERLENARKAEEERKQLFAGARVDMANSFEKLAAEILEDKSKRFTDHNRANIELLLHPLRDKLGEFQLKVEGLQQDGVIGRTELKTQIEALRGMNEKLSVDANNLVKALKNSSKQQGDWGEVLLIGMLEEAGLRAGQEYRVQTSFANEEGKHSRPDIILNLPDDKHLVIDSKVSLTSYTEYCACDDEQSRLGFLERHTRSLRDHIDGLSKKGYQTLHQLRSLDFVVMFVPIEPAYLLALAHDGTLWQRAWKKDVLLVSPGTLFPVIRTIAHIWQQERQTKNVEEILKQASGLYDKMAMFADSFEDVGKRLAGAKSAYDKAFSQLKDGNGDVLGRIGKLKKLGLKTTKKMPEAFLSNDEESSYEDPSESSRATAPNLLELTPPAE